VRRTRLLSRRQDWDDTRGARPSGRAPHLVLVVAAGLLIACGGVTTPGTPTTPGPAISSSAPSPAAAVLTEHDRGRTVRLAIGAEVRLRLSNTYTWTEPRVGTAGIRLVPVDYLRDPGFREWVVSASAAGTVTITSSGTPNCAEGRACPNGPLEFSLTVVTA
jgi:hypothetical protein